MKQTAVEWLVEQLDGERHLTETEINRVIDKAKAMEKQQIIRTHLMARCYDTPNSYNEAEKYYNQTFKSE